MVKASKDTLRDLSSKEVQSRTDEQVRKDIAGGTGQKKPIKPLPEQQMRNVMFVGKALLRMGLPFEFIEEEKQPALEVRLQRLHGSVYAGIFHKNKLGRNEDHVFPPLPAFRGRGVPHEPSLKIA
jgi:hypothetical protein